MRSPHYDAVFVGEARILRIVFVKGVAPHRGPEIVSFQSKEQFKYYGVKLVVVSSKFFIHPSGERGRFIVQENPAVFYGRRALLIKAQLLGKRVLMRNGNV